MLQKELGTGAPATLGARTFPLLAGCSLALLSQSIFVLDRPSPFLFLLFIFLSPSHLPPSPFFLSLSPPPPLLLLTVAHSNLHSHSLSISLSFSSSSFLFVSSFPSVFLVISAIFSIERAERDWPSEA